MSERIARVSIVFPTYNNARFIGASVSAALAQDYSNFEVVVVDDGSTDATEGVLKAIPDTRLRYIKRDRRMGQSAALNEAISQTNGDFIAINDADDLSFPFRLSYVMDSFITGSPPLLVGTNHASANEFCPELPAYNQCEDKTSEGFLTILNKENLYRGTPFAHSSMVFTKDAWHRAGGYNERLSICIDFDFVLRVARLGDIGYLPRKTVLIFFNRNSFYRTKKTSVYLKTLFAVKKQFRRDFRVPLRVRVQDLLYLREFIKH